MPSTPDAISAFRAAGILFGPAKAANAGGVAVSGLEQSQNAQRMSWSAEDVDLKLDTIMEDIHKKCVLHGAEHDFVRRTRVDAEFAREHRMHARGRHRRRGGYPSREG